MGIGFQGNLLDRIEIENISAIKAVKTAEAPYVIVSYGGNYMRPSTKRIPCLYVSYSTLIEAVKPTTFRI